MKYKVSVIVAVYNIESVLARCLESLIHQDLREIEIILVNDASTDQSLEICNHYAGRDERIQVIHKDKNEGLSAARNSGLKQAAGEYVVFVDGDDYVEKDAYQKVYDLAKATEADVIIYGSYYDLLNGERIPMPMSAEKTLYSDEEVSDILMKEVLGALPKNKSDYELGFSPWGRMCRRLLLEENQIDFISERILIYEDLMFALDLYPHVNTVAVLNAPLYHYCENEASLTKRADAGRYKRVKKMYDYIMSEPRYRQIVRGDEETFLRFKRTMLSYIRLCIIQLSVDENGREKIKEITRDSMCKEIMAGYPVWRLPVKQAIFAFLLKYRVSALLYWVTGWYAGR